MTVLGAARGRGHADTAARRRTWITRSGTYLVILFVLAITLVPMLYLILSGFRTTGQLGSNPNGLPHPWCPLPLDLSHGQAVDLGWLSLGWQDLGWSQALVCQ